MISQSIKQGDIFIVDLNPTQGSEQNGRRPVIVVSNKTTNDSLTTVTVMPIVTGGGSVSYAQARGIAVELEARFNLTTTGYIRADQLRALDIKTRNARFVETAPPEVVDNALAIFQAMTDPD